MPSFNHRVTKTQRLMRYLMLFVSLCLCGEALGQTKLRVHDSSGAVSGYKLMDTALGPVLTTSVTNSVAGPTSGVQWTKTGGGTLLAWISAPLNSAVTISGTVTLNTWAKESAVACNCGVQVTVHKYTGGAEQAAFLNTEQAVELGTAIANQNWTATPTSTSFAVDDRIVVKWWINDAGGTMASGRTVTGDYDGATAAADGETFVQFTENISFKAESLSPPTLMMMGVGVN